MNKYLSTIVLAPMTSNKKKYPTRVSVKHNDKLGMIAIDQIRTVDKIRIMKIYDKLSDSEIAEVKEVIKETYVD